MKVLHIVLKLTGNPRAKDNLSISLANSSAVGVKVTDVILPVVLQDIPCKEKNTQHISYCQVLSEQRQFSRTESHLQQKTFTNFIATFNSSFVAATLVIC